MFGIYVQSVGHDANDISHDVIGPFATYEMAVNFRDIHDLDEVYDLVLGIVRMVSVDEAYNLSDRHAAVRAHADTIMSARATDWVDDLLADTPPVPPNPHYACGMMTSPPCPTGEHGPDTWRRYLTVEQQAVAEARAAGIAERVEERSK